MLQSEFRRLTDRPFTEEQFFAIHEVYCYYPGIESHADIANIWTIGGWRLICDMWVTTKIIRQAQERVDKFRHAYEQVRSEYLQAFGEDYYDCD